MRSHRRIAGSWVASAAVVAGVVVPVPAWSAAVAVPSAVAAGAPPALVRAGPSPAYSFGGGDVVTLRSAATVWSGRLTAARVVRLPASVPAAVAGAVVLSVSVSGATRPGRVTVAPSGVPGAGTTAAEYTRGSSGSAVVFVSSGSGVLRWAASAGSPLVTARVLGWVPRTSPLVVPAAPVARPTLTVPSGGTRVVAVAGVGGIGRDAKSVVLQVRASSSRATASVAVSTSAVPAASSWQRVGRGVSTWLTVVKPSPLGTVAVRARGGAVAVSVRALAWGAGSTTLAGPAAAVGLPAVRPGVVRRLQVTGVGGVPAATAAARTSLSLLAVTAPAGAVVQVWPRRAVGVAPTSRFLGTGTPTTVAVPLSATGTVDVAVSGRKPATVHVVGWSTDTAEQQVTMVPRPGTRILGPQDVAGVTPDALVLRSAPDVGTHLLVNPGTSATRYGRVASVTPLTGGRTRVVLVEAPLTAGFVDYRARFRGPTGATALLRSPGGLSPQGFGVGLSGESWQCENGVSPLAVVSLDLDVTGDVNLDFSMAEATLDFSIKGRVTATATLKTGYTVSCSLKIENPAWLPIGSTGLVARIGGKGTLALAPANDDGTPTTAATATAYGAFYAAVYATPGGVVRDATAAGGGSASFQQAITGRLDLGVYVGIQPVATATSGLGPTASITLGMSLSYGPPAQYRGPRCVDLALGPFVDVGVEFVTKLLGLTFSFSLPRVDGPKITLHRGPCWGYQGTVTTTFKSEQELPGITRDSNLDTYTATMLPQAAKYRTDGVVLQEFSWTGQREGSSWAVNSCSSTTTGSGSGITRYSTGIPYLWVEDSNINFQLPGHGSGTSTITRVCPGQPDSVTTNSLTFAGVGGPWVPLNPTAPTSSLPAVVMSRTRIDESPPGTTWITKATYTIDASLQRVEFPGSARPADS